MKNSIGNVLTLTVFGESHGPAVGGVLDGLPSGITVDAEWIALRLSQRRAHGTAATSRREEDCP